MLKELYLLYSAKGRVPKSNRKELEVADGAENTVFKRIQDIPKALLNETPKLCVSP